MATGGQNTDEEFVAIDGIVASGEYGVAVAPETATSELGVTWNDHGLTTDAGVTRSSQATRTIRRAWQNNTKLRTLTTDAGVRFQFILTQTNAANVSLFHGVELVAGSLITNPNQDWPLIAFCFDKIDGDNIIREYAPRARVVEVQDQVAVAGDTWGYPITVEAEYDDTLEGFTQLWYSEFETQPVPTISAATPSGAAAADIIHIVGTNFTTVTGAAGVKIGGTNATSYEVISDTSIYAVLPAGGAGSAPVLVTNNGGASSAFAYTRA
jgi:hypothetical protein